MKVTDYKQRVAALGCILCQACGLQQQTRTTLHHPRIGQGKGQRASDWLVIPLCHEHHQGASGIENRIAFYCRYKMDELDLLALTIERMQHDA